MIPFRRILIASVLALTACATVEEALPPDPMQGSNPPVTFNASIGVATRTEIDDGRMVTWSEGDRITVFDSSGKSEEFTVTEGCSEFSFTSHGIIGPGPYYAVAGYGTDTPAFDKVDRRISIALPATSSDGSFGGADLIASTTEGTSFTFHHVFAILKFSVSSADVTSVRFSAEGISADGNTLIGFDGDGSIVAEYDRGGNEAGIESIPGPGTYYIAVNPGQYDRFSLFMMRAQALMMAESDKGFTASADRMVNFGTLDVFTPSYSEWQLVTNTGDLNAGDEIIIAASDYGFALGNIKSTYCLADPISKSSDKNTLEEEPAGGVQRFTVTTGSSSGQFGLYNGTNYLSTTTNGSGFSTQEEVFNWTISINNGIANIKGRSYYIRYNGTKKTFVLLSSSQQASVSIYKKAVFPQEGPQMIEVNAFLDETAPGVYTYDARSDAVESLYTYNEGADQYAVGENSFRIQNLAEGKLAGIVLDRTGGDIWSKSGASVMLYGITGYRQGSCRKTFIVRKVEDGTVWLLEENGTLGFIINTK